MSRQDELEAQVREISLDERLHKCKKIVAKMCSEGRPPKMTIPVQWDDEDFFMVTTINDALKAI